MNAHTQDELPEEGTVGSNHPYECRCDTCLRWWAEMGGEKEDEAVFNYGPFSKQEVNEEQLRLGLEMTP